MQQRMSNIRGDFSEWLKHKSARVHRGMREGQFRRMHDHISKQENIDINRARALGRLLRTVPAHVAFDSENACDEVLRSESGFHLDRAIQELRLSGEFDRLGFIVRRTLSNEAQPGELTEGTLQVRFPVAKIRS